MIKITVNGKNVTAFESRRPKGYRISHGTINGNSADELVTLKDAVVAAGYTIIKAEIQVSAFGGVPVVWFK